MRYRFVVDRDGNLLHDGSPVRSAGVLDLFARGLDEDKDGLFFRCAGERCAVDAEDTPLVVRSARAVRDSEGRPLRVVGNLGMGMEEELDLESLRLEGGVPYVRVRHGKLRARLSRAAFLTVGELLEPEGDDFVLPFASHRLKVAAAG